ncbi:MAG: DEAD/DEAH box helicase [Thermomicrobiales bacterium]
MLDEADEMLDMGFIEDIEAILKETARRPPDGAVLGHDARPGSPRLAKQYMHGSPSGSPSRPEQMTVPQVRQIYYEAGGRDKFEVLARVLDFEMPTSAMVFCRTKSEVDSTGDAGLQRARPIAAETLHGDLTPDACATA